MKGTSKGDPKTGVENWTDQTSSLKQNATTPKSQPQQGGSKPFLFSRVGANCLTPSEKKFSLV